jgi:glycosyltransferase involved in cell wall biosynthesis
MASVIGRARPPANIRLHRAQAPEAPSGRPRVCVLGSGTRFLGGLSYYTHRFSHALAERNDTSVILMRRLLPRRFYPGASRVGHELVELRWSRAIPVFDGVDWWAVPSLARAVRFLVRQHPDVVVLQWWTATVGHSYFVLALVARATRARVVVEYHEAHDADEVLVPGVAHYAGLMRRALSLLSAAYVVHSPQDSVPLQQPAARGRPVMVVPHGPYDQYAGTAAEPVREAPPDVINVLFFGLIRPYKGLEDLIAALGALDRGQAARYWLTIVGETWEGCVDPVVLAARSPFAGRITIINRFVHDEEVAGFFAGADAVALPYRRSSGSGALQIAMSFGLPVIVTAVGGLLYAVSDYEGAVVARPHDVASLTSALLTLPSKMGRRYADAHTWNDTTEAYERLIQYVMGTAPRRDRAATDRLVSAPRAALTAEQVLDPPRPVKQPREPGLEHSEAVPA